MTSPEETPAVAQPGPRARTLRTALQTLVAVCVALPSALAVVPIPDRYNGSVALVVGIAGAVVVLVSAVQNTIEGRRGSPLAG